MEYNDSLNLLAGAYGTYPVISGAGTKDFPTNAHYI